MSNEPKGTDELQAEIAREFRNFKASPGLEIGLRPELGTFELCDKHYDASKTESPEHCAVCKLEAAGQWISVEERLPKPYVDEVYIWPRPDFGVTHHTGYLSKRTGETELQWFCNTYGDYGVEENTVRVTHWMPLPPPPESKP